MKRQPPADTADQDLRRENALLRGLLQTLGRDAAYNQQVMTRFQDRNWRCSAQATWCDYWND